MAWDGTFDWRQDTSVFARKWELYIKPENEIHVATAVVLDYGTQLHLHNEGYHKWYAESVLPIADQRENETDPIDLDKNIEAAKKLAELMVRAIFA
ncbi:hypothetical protein ACFYVL_33435 [Streptomyces sp. NPDC004111]|uniref:hypothetical protein n=1 Tax=Streptomyces sp. NPDC004111 TaxID=3364690 RepID=UPI0036C4138F